MSDLDSFVDAIFLHFHEEDFQMATCLHTGPCDSLGAPEWDAKIKFCSRYSGHELNGRMVISLVVTSSFYVPYGHAHIVFEWKDNRDHVKHERIEEYKRLTNDGAYRKHKVFHLLPKESFGGFGVFQLIGRGLSGSTDSGEIKRGKTVPGGKLSGPSAAHRESGFFEHQHTTMNVSFASWCVPWLEGKKAFDAAKADFKNADGVAFKLVGSGSGDNCISWSKKTLLLAGIRIDAASPVGAVSSGVAFKTDAELAEIMKGDAEGTLAYWTRGVPST